MSALPVWLQALVWGLVAAVMAFGSGVLISALSLVLMEEAYKAGKRSGQQQSKSGGSGMAIALGSPCWPTP